MLIKVDKDRGVSKCGLPFVSVNIINFLSTKCGSFAVILTLPLHISQITKSLTKLHTMLI